MYDLAKINKKNICIIGLMGSGKSMIGKELSRYLNFKFYDTDSEIEKITNKSVSKIFKEDGEFFFRDIEQKICLNLLNNSNCVISLGGGSIINKKVRKVIKQNSYSIYLEVKLNNLVNRLQSKRKRPLLNTNQSKLEILKNLYYERKNFYEKANFIVNNDDDKFKVLNKIKTQLKVNEK